MKTIFCTLIFSALFFTGCSTIILVRSSWDNNNIIIDGNEKDWTDRTFYLNEQNISFGIRNDEENLFVFFKAVDRQQIRNIRAAGLTIWFDPNGSDGKKYGIRIPGKPMQPGIGSDLDPQIFSNDVTEIEIFTKEKKEPTQVPIVELKGIQFATARTAESFILECKIPLKESVDNPMHWNVTNKEIGVTLEAGKMVPSKKEEAKYEFDGSQEGTGERPAGGRGYSGGRGGEGGRRRGGGGEFKQGEKKAPLDFWFKVRLAEPKK